jgi:hypothetical protein
MGIPGPFRSLKFVALEDTVSGSKRSGMVIDMALRKQLRNSRRCR